MLVSELLKKTNQSSLGESKMKDNGVDVNSLLKKFNDLSLQTQLTVKARNNKMDQKITKIEKDLQIFSNSDEADKLNIQLDHLKTNLADAIEEDEKVELVVKGRVKNAHENFQAHIDDLRLESRDILSGFVRESEKQLFTVDMALKKQHKAFQENLSGYNSQLNDAVELLYREEEAMAEDRQNKTKELKDDIFGQLEALEEDLMFEKSVREQTEDKLRELIDQINTDLDFKIAAEKKEREASNNSLLNLLEQACAKLEKNFLNY